MISQGRAEGAGKEKEHGGEEDGRSRGSIGKEGEGMLGETGETRTERAEEETGREGRLSVV